MKTALLCMGVVGAFGCADGSGARDSAPADTASASSEDVRLHTDSSAYTLAYDGRGWTTSIGYRYQNSSTDTVYVMNCNNQITMHLQQQDAGQWKDVWAGATNGCMSPPILILPGSSFSGRLVIWGAEQGTTWTTAFATDDFRGRFRLVWHQPILHYTGHGPELGDTLPEEQRRSNEFSLTRADTARS